MTVVSIVLHTSVLVCACERKCVCECALMLDWCDVCECMRESECMYENVL
jgi:hypothetical protein